MTLIELKEKLKQLILGYSNFSPSFSQSGEDMILRGIFQRVFNGFYIDIGAYHPVIGSNTFYFYKFLGWTGINIEPNPDNFPLFEKMRSQDINLNMGISEKEQELNYYMVDQLPAMNTFSEEFLRTSNMYDHISRVKLIPTNTLKNILNKYHSENKAIDIMNIDVEGLDLQVLNSNDWEKYRPKCIVIEVDNSALFKGKIHQFLSEKGYVIMGLTPVNTKINSTCIYLDDNWIKDFSNY